MSCFFCTSNEHISQNCDVHKSNEERRKFLREKIYCYKCLTRQRPYDRSCENCETHASNVLHPNINHDLTPRYMKMLTIKEKYSLFSSFLIDPDFVKLTPFKVKTVERIYFSEISRFEEYDFLVAEKAYLNAASLPFSQNVNFVVQHLEFGSDTYPSNEIIKLLSSNTKTLTCKGYHFYKKLTIVDILKHAPNLDYIVYDYINAEIKNSWHDDLLQLSRDGKLKQMVTSVYDWNFDVESLATFMKTKSAAVSLNIHITIQNGRFNQQKILQKVTYKLSKYFTSNTSKCLFFTGLFVHVFDEFGSSVSKQYVLKNTRGF